MQDEINLLRLGNLIYRKNKFQLMARSPLATVYCQINLASFQSMKAKIIEMDG